MRNQRKQNTEKHYADIPELEEESESLDESLLESELSPLESESSDELLELYFFLFFPRFFFVFFSLILSAFDFKIEFRDSSSFLLSSLLLVKFKAENKFGIKFNVKHHQSSKYDLFLMS